MPETLQAVGSDHVVPDSIAADPGIQNGDLGCMAVTGKQALGKFAWPGVVGVQSGASAVGNRITERNDRCGIVWRGDVNTLDPIPGGLRCRAGNFGLRCEV